MSIKKKSHDDDDNDDNDNENNNKEDYVPFLDAEIVGWNLRDKKTHAGPVTFLRKSNFKFDAGRQHFTPIYEQSRYKYLVYVDGHCAACRYGFMMRLGSVILKVAPRQVADTMWYFPLLKPYVDHVPVKADLSDLKEKIEWCRSHDEECKVIGENAKIFYEKYVGREALLDYIQMVCRQISARTIMVPEWWEEPPPPSDPPSGLRKPEGVCFKERGESGGASEGGRNCVRCQEEIDEEERKLVEKEQKNKQDKAKKKMGKSALSERRRRKAKAAEAAAKKEKIEEEIVVSKKAKMEE